MINLYRDPQGERIFDKSNPTAKQPSDAPLSTYTKAESKNGEDVAPLLRRKIQEQEEVIEAKDMKIRELQEIINTMWGECFNPLPTNDAWLVRVNTVLRYCMSP